MRAVHFGAGNIGRGFIGLLLSQSGFQVQFVDVNDQLVSLLQQRKQYTVTLADEAQETIVVDNVNAIHGSDLEAVANAIAAADLVTTAVGVSILKHIAAGIAKGIELRLQLNPTPLHIIACENAIGGSSQLKEHVYSHIHPDLHSQADALIAFPDAAVDRIVPIQHHEDPLQVTVEPFHEWVVDRSKVLDSFPEIKGIHVVDQLEPYIERKLFTVNTGHCCTAYHGYLNGCATIQKALEKPEIKHEVESVLNETGQMLVQKYQFDPQTHQAYIQKILNRFMNPYISDEVERVGRSPIRKLSPNDRLVRPAVLAHELGLSTEHLAKAMAAGFAFDYAEDQEAAQLQKDIQAGGIEQVVTQYTGLDHTHPIHQQVVKHYEAYHSRLERRV